MQAAIRIVLLTSIAIALLSSCKSKKSAPQRKPQSTPAASNNRKEYKDLSERLNIDINKQDNIKLYQFVADWLGVPHKDGGCDRRGTDCSCFVRLAYDHAYRKTLPRNSAEMYKQTSRIKQRELKEGDLVFFSIKSTKVSHVGIYLKGGWFAHVSTSKGVMINNLDEAYYKKYYTGAGTVVNL
jgi:murein DD-endopeptidase / murein LD-carboxypeptidase